MSINWVLTSLVFAGVFQASSGSAFYDNPFLNPQHTFSDNFVKSQPNFDFASAGYPPKTQSKPATVKPSVQAFDIESFSPFGNLSLLSTNQFTSLSHPAFPNHGVRVKRSTLCEGESKAYTGYIDSGAHHIFFYFFESRDNPAKDDVVFWTNGGPGGSSALGLFTENGPCRIANSSGPYYHPESWNSNANIMFVEQPVGVGYSYADFGEVVSTTEDAAVDIAAFIAIFFEHFDQFKGRPLHMTGESFGGRYIPLFSAAVYDQNAHLKKVGMAPVNLTSIAIGNGMTMRSSQMVIAYEMLCTGASLPPVMDIQSCVELKQVIPRCKNWIQKNCVESHDFFNCRAALNYCEEFIQGQFAATNRNVFDISKICNKKSPQDVFCGTDGAIIQAVSEWLDRPDVREMLGAEETLGNHSAVNLELNRRFDLSGDISKDSHHHVVELLERGIDVLIYVGTYDLACNWIGNNLWTMNLEWSGREGFVNQPLEPWYVDGKKAGLVRSTSEGRFVFATIDGAGHMAPTDKPKESLELINRWIKDRRL